jgi:putative transcriptional regulator
MEDPNFRHAVVLMCEHTEEGAFGLVVNRVLMESFLPLLVNFDIASSSVDMPVYFGGPVKPELGYIIYAPFDRKYGSMKVAGNIGVTASREMLYEILDGRGPDRYMFALGFSGWGSHQLEDELLTDSWIVAPCNPDIIFAVQASERWRAAARMIGVDFHRYSERSGNA